MMSCEENLQLLSVCLHTDSAAGARERRLADRRDPLSLLSLNAAQYCTVSSSCFLSSAVNTAVSIYQLFTRSISSAQYSDVAVIAAASRVFVCRCCPATRSQHPAVSRAMLDELTVQQLEGERSRHSGDDTVCSELDSCDALRFIAPLIVLCCLPFTALSSGVAGQSHHLQMRCSAAAKPAHVLALSSASSLRRAAAQPRCHRHHAVIRSQRRDG
jgi:hypothetical protein